MATKFMIKMRREETIEMKLAVLGIRIRIRRIRMFLGLPALDLDPLVRGTDPDPAPDPSLFS